MSDLIIYGRCSRFSEPCGLWIDLSDLIYRVDAAPPSLPFFSAACVDTLKNKGRCSACAWINKEKER